MYTEDENRNHVQNHSPAQQRPDDWVMPRRRRRLSPRERRRRLRIARIQLGVLCAVFVLAVGLSIFGVVKLVSFLGKEPDSSPAPLAKFPNEPTPSDSQETLEPTEPQTEQLLAQAEWLASGYDYDAALKVLRSYGEDWTAQPGFQEAADRFAADQNKLEPWPDTTKIPHIFFHSLIVDTDRAFDGDYATDGYNQFMATVDEFRAILEELYARDYVLVRMHDVAALTTGDDGAQVYTQGEILLPPGKKPIIISQDDVNYYEYMIDGDEDHFPDAKGDGFASRIVIGDDGYPICEYVTAQGETVRGEYDLVPILESFVQEHPDFSYRGARAILGVTGYQGVFGYRTHPDWVEILGKDAYDAECAAAKEVSQCLKDKGWEIASHSFGHPSYGDISEQSVATDVAKWEQQVQPLVGDTDIFIYPYGSDIAGIEAYSGAKFESMYDAGYRYFCNVDGSHPYWTQIHDTYVRQGRRNIDGYRMWWNPEMLDDLFDVDQIWDAARPTPVPSVV